MVDLTLLYLGALAAFVWQVNTYAVILTAAPLVIFYLALTIPMLMMKTRLDPKTGLYNSRFFAEVLDKELARACRFNRPLTVAMADMDFMRRVNNTYGHLAGDEVLLSVANILKNSFRKYDVVARFGGEEFAILLPEVSIQEAYYHFEDVRREIDDHEFKISTSESPIHTTISIGLSELEYAGQPSKEIIHNADVALYHSKNTGRNKVSLYLQDGVEEVFSSSPPDPIPNDRINQGEQRTNNGKPRVEYSTQGGVIITKDHAQNSVGHDELNESLLYVLAKALDFRDPYAYGHSERVAHYACRIAEEFGMSEEKIAAIHTAALLHDIGKLAVPDDVLFKPGDLTAEEYEKVKQHTLIGAELLETCLSLHEIIPWILHHHERYDGRGYPSQLRGDEIPFEARILTFADAVDSMASDRPYRLAQDPTYILDEVRRHEKMQFDPEVMDAFFRIIEREGLSFIQNSSSKLPVTKSMVQRTALSP
jgi:diguanylate cyclase (GGDEF)-like protein/putative nucleotidyltransferase with HDIG domain